MKNSSPTTYKVRGPNYSPKRKYSLTPIGLSYRPFRHVKKRSGFVNKSVLAKIVKSITNPLFTTKNKKKSNVIVYKRASNVLPPGVPLHQHSSLIRHLYRVCRILFLSFLI